MRLRRSHGPIQPNAAETRGLHPVPQNLSLVAAILAVDGPASKFAPLTKSLNFGQGTSLWVIWGTAGLCVAFAICVMVDALVVRRRDKRLTTAWAEQGAPPAPARKGPLHWLKKFLRWLLYPSFQDWV